MTVTSLTSAAALRTRCVWAGVRISPRRLCPRTVGGDAGCGWNIATRELPWRVFNVSIDGSGRVWVQVLGGVPDGYHMMRFTRELEPLGRSVVPRFRDAFGDFIVSEEKDSLDVETFVFWKRTPEGR